MALSIPSLTTQPPAATTDTGLLLQPGTVVDARVLQILESGLARVAIAGMTLDVASSVELSPGAALRLAVSQSGNVTQLSIVPSGQTAPATAAAASANANGAGNLGSSTSGAIVGQVPGRPSAVTSPAEVPSVTSPQAASLPSMKPVSPEAMAKIVITEAMRNAAPRQGSLAPLFANAAAISSSQAVPPAMVAQVEKLLSLRPDLDANLGGKDIEAAFKTSGLFLESSLKAVTSQTGSAALPPPGDLKAALLVFRQVLSVWNDAASTAAASQTQLAQPGARANSLPGVEPTVPDAAAVVIAGTDIAATPRQPQGVVQAASVKAALNIDIATVLDASASEARVSDGSVPSPPILKTALQADGTAIKQTIAALPLIEAPALDDSPVPGSLPAGDVQQKSSAPRDMMAPPSPPLRGATPSPQPIASPTLVPLTTPSEIAHTLLRETDAAIARQVLHQIASLPAAPDAAGPANGLSNSRWSFEIPFATAQGTAIAQFEIAGDGGRGAEGRAARKAWSARFSIDVEPAGAVHAHVAMTVSTDGLPRASVRLWAERPETTARLQAGSEQLTQALREADLDPGSVVIAGGSPPNDVRHSGHFLDRAL